MGEGTAEEKRQKIEGERAFFFFLPGEVKRQKCKVASPVPVVTALSVTCVCYSTSSFGRGSVYYVIYCIFEILLSFIL